VIYPDCGTYSAYQRHRRAGEEACAACTEAFNAYQREYRHRTGRSIGGTRTICHEHVSLIEARQPGWVYCRVGGWHSPQIVYELVTAVVVDGTATEESRPL
jgi:hypothetical protein